LSLNATNDGKNWQSASVVRDSQDAEKPFVGCSAAAT
jgi:hypothetical protein